MSFFLPDSRLEQPHMLVPGQKPVCPVQINWDHPLAEDLVGFWLGGSLENYATGKIGTIVGSTMAENLTANGVGWANSGNSTNSRINLGSIPSNNPLSLAGQRKATWFTLIEWGGYTLSSAFPRVIDKSSSGSGAGGWAFYYDSGLPGWFISLDGSNFGVSPTGEIAQPSSPELFSSGISYDLEGGISGTNIGYYSNGLLVATKNTAVTIPTTTTNAAIGNWNHSTDRECAFPILVVAVWSGRVLNANEHLSMRRDPYQLLIPA